MSEPDALIVFTPSGKRGRFPRGTQLLQAARSLGVDVDSVCGGRALCGRCQVLVMEGDFPKHGVSSHADHLSPLSEVEKSYAQRKPLWRRALSLRRFREPELRHSEGFGLHSIRARHTELRRRPFDGPAARCRPGGPSADAIAQLVQVGEHRRLAERPSHQPLLDVVARGAQRQAARQDRANDSHSHSLVG